MEFLIHLLFNFNDLLLRELRRGEDAVIAFSGGQDSTNLLVVSIQKNPNILWCHHLWKKNDFYLFRHIFQISVVFQKRFFYTLFFSKYFSEKEARKYRYFSFFRILNYSSSNFLLTAHTLNDNIETFFINLFRGSSIRDLRYLQPLTNFECSQKFY